MKYRLKSLGKDSIVYGIGAIASRAVGFFTLPIYTRIFAPVDYGTIELLALVGNFLAIFVAMGTGSSLTFYFYSKEVKSKAQVVTATLQWYLIWGTGIVALAISTSPILNSVFFKNELTWKMFAVAFVGVLLGQINGLIVDVFRLIYRPWSYLSVSLGSSLLSVAASLIFVVWLNWGITGIFVGSTTGSLMGVFIGWFGVRNYINWKRGHWDFWPKLLRFGVPLVPGSISAYFLRASDRWLINYYLSRHDLGLYSLGARFAFLIRQMVDAFMKAFLPFSMDLLNSDDKAEIDRWFEVIFRYYGGIALGLIIVVTGLSPYIVQVLAPAEYYEAVKIIGVLSMTGVFFGGTYFSSLGCWKVEKTHLYSLSEFISFIVNLVLNVLLIPTYGIMGASIASASAMFTLVGVSFYLSQKHWRIAFNLPLAFTQTLMCVCALLAFHFGEKEVVNHFTARLLMVIALCVLAGITVRRSEALKLLGTLR